MLKQLLYGALLTAAALSHAGEFRNLLLNGDFICKDGDLPLYWMARNHTPGTAAGFQNGGPDNAPFLRIQATRGDFYVKQTYLTLKKGEKYMLSGWFRSEGLQGEENGIAIHPGETAVHLRVPENQKEWLYLEKEITVLYDAPKGGHDIALRVNAANGRMDVARLSLRAVTREGDEASLTQREMVGPSLVPLGMLRFIPRHKPELKFYWVGKCPWEKQKAECVFSLKGKEIRIPFSLQTMRLPLKGFATDKKEHALKLEIRDAASQQVMHRQEYAIRFMEFPRPDPKARRLNNLVTLLRNTPLQPGETVSVVNPRNGWILFRYQTKDGTPGSLILQGKELMAADFPTTSAIRFLEPGVYRLKNTGSQPLNGDIRLIPDIHLFPLGNTCIPGNGIYDWEFAKKNMLPALTTINIGLNPEQRAEASRVGLRHLSNFGVLNPQKKNDSDDLLKRLTEFKDLQNDLYDGTTLDEVEYWDGPAISPYVSALKRFPDPKALLESWVIGPASPAFCDYISTAVNVSGGNGRILYEVYNRMQYTEAENADYLTSNLQHVQIYRDIFPEMLGNLSIILGNFSAMPCISLDHIPSVDFRYSLDMQMQRLATHASCDGLGGVGFWGAHNCDEETWRWCAALLRHYAVEGNTTLLSEKYGYTYSLDFIRNGDFEKGLDHWETAGKVFQASQKDFGAKSQGRYGSVYPLGDAFAVLERTEQPATLKQKITGLVPGKKYSVTYIVADYDDILNGINHPRRFPLELTVGGSEICRRSYYVDDRKRPKMNARINVCKLVFVPESTEATLLFSTERAEPGRRLALNYIKVRAYFDK